MSSLEERREARRRRRAAEDEAASTNGGEDDLERRRRERREARIRGDSTPAEDTSSRRNRRNRGGDEEAPAEETTSARSRRRRGGDEEAEAAAPEPAQEEEKAEEPAVDDSAAREAEEAERRRREEEEEERRRQQEEERSRQEEERRKQQEEQRRREEQRKEEERQKRKWKEAEADCRSVGTSVTSSPDSGLPRVYSPIDHGGGGGPVGPFSRGSNQSGCSSRYSLEQSLHSEGVFSCPSDDNITDLAGDSQRLLDLSSDCDLGSSFDDFMQQTDQDSDRKSPRHAHRKRRSHTRDLASSVPIRQCEQEGSQCQPQHDPTPHSSRHPSSVVPSNDSTRPRPVEKRSLDENREYQASTARNQPSSLSRKEDSGTKMAGLTRQYDVRDSHTRSSALYRRHSDGFEFKESFCQTRSNNDRRLSLDSKRTRPAVYIEEKGEPRATQQDYARDSLPEAKISSSFRYNTASMSIYEEDESLATSPHTESFDASHQRPAPCGEDVVDVDDGSGNERSDSCPSVPGSGRHFGSSRMSELQRQLRVRTEKDSFPAMRKMHSQGDLSLSSARTGSQINNIINKLSHRLKKRESKQGMDKLYSQQSKFSGYRCQSEPTVSALTEDKLTEPPRAASLLRGKRLSGALFSDESRSSRKTGVRNEHIIEPGNEDSKESTNTQHPAHHPPLHAAPPSHPVHRPASGCHPPHTDRPPQELRLCLDFADDQAEEADNEEEEEEGGRGGGGGKGTISLPPCLKQHEIGEDRSIDWGSSSSLSEIPPPPEYSDMEDPSQYFSLPAQIPLQADVSIHDKQRAGIGIPALKEMMGNDEELPLITTLLKSSVRDHSSEGTGSPSPPLPPPPSLCSSSTPPPSLPLPAFSASDLCDTPRMTPPPPLMESPPQSPQPTEWSNSPRSFQLSRVINCPSLPVAPTPPPPSPPPPLVPPIEDPTVPSRERNTDNYSRCNEHDYRYRESESRYRDNDSRYREDSRCKESDSRYIDDPRYKESDSRYSENDYRNRESDSKYSENNSPKASAQRTDKKNDVDLHSALCAQIAQLEQTKTKRDIQHGSLRVVSHHRQSSSDNNTDSSDHLIRPSALKTGSSLHDWGTGLVDPEKRSVTLGSVISTRPKRTENLPLEKDPAILSGSSSGAERDTQSRGRKTRAASESGHLWRREPAEGSLMTDIFLQNDEGATIEEQLRQWKASRSNKLKPVRNNETETRSAAPTVSKSESWTADMQDSKPHVPSTVSQQPSDETGFRSREDQAVLVSRTHSEDLSGITSGVVENKKRKVPPPTLPKSASLTSLPHCRLYIPDNSPTGQVFRQNSFTRLSSTSSMDSEIFGLNRQDESIDEQNDFSQELGRKNMPLTHSAQIPSRQNSFNESTPKITRRYSSIECNKTAGQRQSTYELPPVMGRRHYSVDMSGAVPTLSSWDGTQRFERNRPMNALVGGPERLPSESDHGFDQEHSVCGLSPGTGRALSVSDSTQTSILPAIDSARGVEYKHSVDPNRRVRRSHSSVESYRPPERSQSPSMSTRGFERRYSSMESSKVPEQRNPSYNYTRGTERRYSPATTVPEEKLPSRNFLPDHAINRNAESLGSHSLDTTGRWNSSAKEAQQALPVPPAESVKEEDTSRERSHSFSESDTPKKRAAPRPRFNARRLTQSSEIPVMWQCSEEAKSLYKPPPPITDRSFVSGSGVWDQDTLDDSEQQAGRERRKSEYSSWAAEFVRDRILANTENSGSQSERGTHTASPATFNLDQSGDSQILSARTPPVTQSKPMSISERIGMLHKCKSPKPSSSSVSDIKSGFMSDRTGLGEKPTKKAPTDLETTTEQKKFASLLQNRLINIIAEEDAEAKREREREKEREKTKKVPSIKKKLTPAQEIARCRALSTGSKKPLKLDLPVWSPDMTSTPAPSSQALTDSLKMSREKSGSVKNLTKEFSQLSDYLSTESAEEQEKRRLNTRRRRSRRLTTGLSVKEMKDMFDNADSNPSSSNSTRANTPRPVTTVQDKSLDRFNNPVIAENRPLTDKGMVSLSRFGSQSSVSDIINKVETSTKDSLKAFSQKTLRFAERGSGGSSTSRSTVSMSHTSAVPATEVGADSSRKSRMNKSRRFTTGVNFEELQLRFNRPDTLKKANQNRAMSTVYASSQDISTRWPLNTKTSARSMENLAFGSNVHRGNLRVSKQWQTSADNALDESRDSVFDKSRSESYSQAPDSPCGSPRDIQSTSGSAFNRVSAFHSPIKVVEALPSPLSSRSSSVCSRRQSLDTVSAPSRRYSCTLLEEEERMEAERQEQERKQREEEERRKEEEEKKKKKKRKGLGGLSPEKKKLLKKLIMQKAAEDLRNEAKAKAEEKEKYINERVTPLKADGMGQAELQKLVKELHSKVAVLEEEVYDWEIKIRKQDFEINELTLKVNDTKGKFIKPVLRKVNKTESKLTKLQTKESRDFRGNLKSTGQNKFALKEEDETPKQPDWRKDLKHGAEGEGEEVPAES